MNRRTLSLCHGSGCCVTHCSPAQKRVRQWSWRCYASTNTRLLCPLTAARRVECAEALCFSRRTCPWAACWLRVVACICPLICSPKRLQHPCATSSTPVQTPNGTSARVASPMDTRPRVRFADFECIASVRGTWVTACHAVARNAKAHGAASGANTKRKVELPVK